MKLRCWPGCLAYMARANFPENVGLLVEVVERAPNKPDGSPCWFADAMQPRRASNGLGAVKLTTRARIPDAWLRPITPPPGSETETTGEPIKEVA